MEHIIAVVLVKLFLASVLGWLLSRGRKPVIDHSIRVRASVRVPWAQYGERCDPI